jgi:Tfp pilus assembly protein PilN
VWTNSLNNKIAVSESSYQTKLTGLMANPRNKDIIDFQDRLSASNDLVAQTNVPVDALSEIEKTLVAGVYLTSYTVDAAAKTLSLECVADSYASVAKQALSFKSSKYFSEVNVKKASLSDGGKDIFSVDIKLN